MFKRFDIQTLLVYGERNHVGMSINTGKEAANIYTIMVSRIGGEVENKVIRGQIIPI